MSRFINFFTDRRTHIAIGVALIVTACTILAMTISYFKTGTADQSEIANRTIEQVAASADGVANIGGPAGAKLSHSIIVNNFGVAGLVLVIYIGLLGLALVKIVKIRFWSLTFRCLYTTIALSIVLGLLTYNVESPIHWGGNHGRYVNQWLMRYIDILGAYAVTLILIGSLVAMYLNQIVRAWRTASSRAASIKAAQEERRSRRKAALATFDTADAETSTGDSDSDSDAATDAHTYGGASNPADDNAPERRTEQRELSDLPDTPIDEPESNSDKTGGSATGADTGTAGEPEFVITNPDTSADKAQPAATTTPSGGLDTPFDPRAELSRYVFPGIDLLKERKASAVIDEQEQQENKEMIIHSLRSYGIEISRIEATIGPTVTLYEIVPAEGVRIAQIKRLEDDIQMSLAALGIRIIAPIPGKGSIGIEVPNRDPQTVSFRSVITSPKFTDCRMILPMALGKTVSNDVFVADLAKMPHLLVAGATGQGKSVGLNCIIASLLYKKHPTELKFVLVDPKMVEFSLYGKLSHHYLAKLPDADNAIITDTSRVVPTLNSLCVLMDSRYELLMKAGVRSIEEYNTKFTARRLNPEHGHYFMPYIVVVVDEFADLIATAGKDVLMYISRIAAKARAVGIHMIIATQRPSTDVITGVIKNNFPGRIAFKVSSSVDSRTILDGPGANRLIGRGDMLFSHNSKLDRVQCAFIDTDEVEAIAEHIDNQIGFETAYLLPEPATDCPGGVTTGVGRVDLSQRDELFDDCARFVVQNPTASTSSLQRRFAIGYNKAGKIMDQLEAAGIVGPADGARPRQVLFTTDQLEDFLRNS